MLLKHQETGSEENTIDNNMLKCPLCRGNFNTVIALKLEFRQMLAKTKMKISDISVIPIHDVSCCFCKTKPVRGNLYRCLDCCSILLCAICLSSEDFRIYHGSHNYAIKQKSDGPWRRLGTVEEYSKAFNRNGNAFFVPRASFSKTKNLLEFSKEFSFNCSNGDNFCEICKTVINNINNLATTYGHHFHQNCLEDRIKTSEKCPLDNMKIRPIPLKRKYVRPVEMNISGRNGIVMGPLEVRISRMHLEQRNKETSNKSTTSNVFTSSTPQKSCKNKSKIDVPKMNRPTTSVHISDLDERSLSRRVNPLMSILMLPHLKQFIDVDKKKNEENEAGFRKHPLNKIKLSSLELPVEYNRKTKFQTKSPANPFCGKKLFERSKSSTGALQRANKEP